MTFQYRDGETKQLKTKTVTAEEFIRRFLQHVLPHRFIKVRYYSFLSSSHRKRLEKVKELLNIKPVATDPIDAADTQTPEECEAQAMRCPKCGGVMKLVGEVAPKRTRSP